jgi:predicted SAM-dependent methyltransferase
MSEPDYLNIGCGGRFCPDWVNVDVAPSHPSVQRCDIARGLPFPDGRFRLVYHSHVLEHLDKESAGFFIGECHRVLEPGGIIRIAVPDLEAIASRYLHYLEEAVSDISGAQEKYDWMMLELYDQTVRNVSGGGMAWYLRRENLDNLEFIQERCGAEIAGIHQGAHQFQAADSLRPMKSQKKVPNRSVGNLVARLKEGFLRAILQDDYPKLQLGRFRNSGEVHQWMYDRYSLRRLLEGAGFKNLAQRDADRSYVKEWSSYYLDTDEDGQVRKPDSLFMEGVR